MPESQAITHVPRPIVYIVDDDATVRRSTWFMLSAAGFQPRAFAGGADFLDALPELAVGAVLLDLQMPEVGGFDVLQAVMRSDAAFPVIVVTGFGGVSGAVKAMKLGAVDFIEKPYVEDALIAVIESALVASRGADEAKQRRRAAQRKLEQLTPRERDVLELMVAGLPNKLIAYRLQISNRTVEMHRASMMDRLGQSSFSGAIRLAITAGLDPLPAEQA
ncbi:response regulator transcription factor [Sphingomonas sp. PAMC 26605]|uniref:response regulator transcription factor n=1 Tax=Sphingomonas sp. PAMC 26605 TaxID=1112214 RepID=UPI0002D85AD8|nr:response regulator [Sphingomonas sp. PAMC 26605]